MYTAVSLCMSCYYNNMYFNKLNLCVSVFLGIRLLCIVCIYIRFDCCMSSLITRYKVEHNPHYFKVGLHNRIKLAQLQLNADHFLWNLWCSSHLSSCFTPPAIFLVSHLWIYEWVILFTWIVDFLILITLEIKTFLAGGYYAAK